MQAVATMKQGKVRNLDVTLALAAAKISVDQKLAMADSIILATARAFGAVLWTQDEDLDGIERVRYFRKK